MAVPLQTSMSCVLRSLIVVNALSKVLYPFNIVCSNTERFSISRSFPQHSLGVLLH